jgi:S1-C subfamily serine protease
MRVLIVLLIGCVTSFAEEAFRVWTQIDGEETIAKLTSYDDDREIATLETKDGAVLKLAFEVFSLKDQDYIDLYVVDQVMARSARLKKGTPKQTPVPPTEPKPKPTSEPSEPAIDRETLMGAVAVIETDVSQGSGFVVKMQEQLYLVTNAHVLSGCKSFTVKLPDGSSLDVDELEASKSKDLLRAKVISGGPQQPLTLASVTPKMGSEILVYGNSDGRGVITQLDGVINGVGPDPLDVSAEFISGNSGGPLRHSQSGEILMLV